MTSTTPTRISLWSGPRNVSTALMYAFAQRKDTQVHDEPLYAHYLSHSDAHTFHPGAADILEAQDNNGREVIEDLMVLLAYLSKSPETALSFEIDRPSLLDNVILVTGQIIHLDGGPFIYG